MSDSAPDPAAPTAPAASLFERTRALAKRLLRECRAGDAAALERVRAQLPRLAALAPAEAAAAVRLADVQHALAREANAANWAALKATVEAAEPLARQVARFLQALPGSDFDTMRRVLESHPDVARTSIHAACAALDPALVEAWLARDPALATARFADSTWTPLACVAASPLFRLGAERVNASVAIARRLLALGADPNATARVHGDAHPLPVMYFASVQGHAALVQVLLEAGADPDDGESVYHAAEHDHRDVLERLLAHGAEVSAVHPQWGNTPLFFLAGYRDTDRRAAGARAGMRWLLEHGADPNVASGPPRETPLHRVADYGCDVAVAELLLAHGADPGRERADGRTAYDLAVRGGHVALEALLRARGAAREPRPADALLGACARGDLAAARAVLAAHPGLLASAAAELRHAPVVAAGHGRAEAIRVFAALGFDLAVTGEQGATAMHWAAWHGHLAAVRALLEAGAPFDEREPTYGSTPLAWAAHGSANCRDADDDYGAIVELLLAAGARREPSFNRWGEPPEALASEAIADLLRQRGFAPPE